MSLLAGSVSYLAEALVVPTGPVRRGFVFVRGVSNSVSCEHKLVGETPGTLLPEAALRWLLRHGSARSWHCTAGQLRGAVQCTRWCWARGCWDCGFISRGVRSRIPSRVCIFHSVLGDALGRLSCPAGFRDLRNGVYPCCCARARSLS